MKFPIQYIQHTNKSKVFAVKFASIREHNGSGGHVQAHGKCFGGKEGLDQTLSK